MSIFLTSSISTIQTETIKWHLKIKFWYHDNSESDVDAVEDRNCSVFIGRSDRFPTKGFEYVPRQYKDKQEIEAEIPVEETSNNDKAFAFLQNTKTIDWWHFKLEHN